MMQNIIRKSGNYESNTTTIMNDKRKQRKQFVKRRGLIVNDKTMEIQWEMLN